VILLASGPIAKGLGRTGMNVATRFMGLILAAIAVEFIASGLGELFPAWKRG
jgi:multiple antibiotic resistance protein